MPELPEAETIARALHRSLTAQVVERVTVVRKDVVHGDARPLGRLLRGRRVLGVGRRAKRVIVSLDADTRLTFHLGMSGRLTVASRGEPVEKHTHLRIEFGGEAGELRFCDPRRFGGVWCHVGAIDPKSQRGRVLGEVGIEPLDAKPAVFLRLLDRRRRIKTFLLDQRMIAGIGNIYCDEALHAARIHPCTPCDELGAIRGRTLLRSIKTTLNSAIRFKGSTLNDYRQVDGSEGSFQKRHRVYQREGEPCKRCDGLIERIIVTGRSTFFCPACQPLDRPT